MNRLKSMRDLIREEDGMGTVEIILIIVEIFIDNNIVYHVY